MGWFSHQNCGISHWQCWLQISIWVLIVPWHDQYIHCTVLSAFTSHCQICDWTNFCWVAIDCLGISPKIRWNFTAIQRILVQSQIWKPVVEVRLKLHNLCIDHVMIGWDLKYLIGAKGTGTVKWNCGAGTTWPKNRGFMSSLGNNPAKIEWVGFLPRSGTKPNHRSKPGLLIGNPYPLVRTILSRGFPGQSGSVLTLWQTSGTVHCGCVFSYQCWQYA